MQSGGPQLCRYIPVVGVTPLLRRSLVAVDSRSRWSPPHRRSERAVTRP